MLGLDGPQRKKQRSSDAKKKSKKPTQTKEEMSRAESQGLKRSF